MVIHRSKYLLPVVLLLVFGGYGRAAEVRLKVIDPIESVISPNNNLPAASIDDLQELQVPIRTRALQAKHFQAPLVAVRYRQQLKEFLTVKVLTYNILMAHCAMYPPEKEVVS